MPSAALLACALLVLLGPPGAAADGSGGSRPPAFVRWLADVRQQVELAQQWKQGRVAAGKSNGQRGSAAVSAGGWFEPGGDRRPRTAGALIASSGRNRRLLQAAPAGSAARAVPAAGGLQHAPALAGPRTARCCATEAAVSPHARAHPASQDDYDIPALAASGSEGPLVMGQGGAASAGAAEQSLRSGGACCVRASVPASEPTPSYGRRQSPGSRQCQLPAACRC
jgi:hypothetical protein